jgi:hypothetical protein
LFIDMLAMYVCIYISRLYMRTSESSPYTYTMCIYTHTRNVIDCIHV